MSATQFSDSQFALSRRHVLQAGGLGLAGLSLPALLRAQAKSSTVPASADACILIYLNGGPSHLDMWDMKPKAADGIRGEFQQISSTLPEVPICEYMPRLAKQMHRTTVVRSMNHRVNNAHALAVYTAITGHDKGDANVIVGAGPEDHPSPGSTIAKLRPPETTAIPYVTLPYKTKEGANGPPQPGFFGGFIGQAYDPLYVLKDPNAADFSVPELTLMSDVTRSRLDARRELYRSVNELASRGLNRSNIEAMDSFQHRALDLLTSESTQQAFRISQETDVTRESYGRNIYGQSVLLARRLIEAGTRMVTISWAPDANATWDTHSGNFEKLKTKLLPQFDAAYASLLDDLETRGMLERTVIAVLGDFGRTPKINGNNAGRDHWNYCYSVMLAGGGIRPGFVYGASDATGAFPAKDPITPGDIIATLYRTLGIRHDMLLYDQLDRPHRLIPEGRIVSELLA